MNKNQLMQRTVTFKLWHCFQCENVYHQFCTQMLSWKLGRHSSVHVLCDN